jgi:hypothetical protein
MLNISKCIKSRYADNFVDSRGQPSRIQTHAVLWRRAARIHVAALSCSCRDADVLVTSPVKTIRSG